ncbi:MAG: UbiA family prenyltransferase, partial [Phycisphaerales bacterium]|nr:UbiA family prenyltransferase [Phycisphaerales bacterium]
MRRLFLRLVAALQLTRITTAFAAVANVWFVIFWTAHVKAEGSTPAFAALPLWLMLAGGAVNALGLFGFATALNDVLDYRRDQALHPERPIPSGRVSLDGAVSLVVCTLGAAVLGATLLGMTSVLLTLLIAGAILFFNAAGKYIPAIGLIVLGLIYAGQMVVPNLNLKFVLPVWVVMTHALAVAGATHVLGR